MLITSALLSLRSLLNSNQEIKQSHRMMTIHLTLFNIYSVVYTVQEVVFYGYIYGYFDMTLWQAEITVDSFAFAAIFSFFLLNQFIAYLMLQFGNPDEKSQDMLFRFLMG